MALGVLFLVAIVRLTFIALPDAQSHVEVWIRFVWIWGTLYFLRACAVGITRYPRIILTGPMPPPGLMPGMWGLVTGEFSSQTDFMFSGHTATMTLLGLFVSYYTFRSLFSKLYWVLVLCGYYAVIAARIHYTSDVVIAVMVTLILFYLFHAIADPDWLSGWRASLVINMQTDIELGLPLRITDSNGRVWTVVSTSSTAPLLENREMTPTMTKKRTDDTGGSLLRVLHVGRYSTPERRSLYQGFVQLLGGYTQ